jgi:hypothetical protein
VGRVILPAGALSSAPKRRLKGGGTVESPTQLVEKPWTPHWAFITIGGPQAHPDSQDCWDARPRTDIDENGAMRCAKVAAANRAAESVGLFDLERAENR